MWLTNVFYFYTVLSLLGVWIFFAYLWLKKKYTYWDKFGVKSCKPKLFFGNYEDVIFARCNEADITDRAYRELEGSKYGGLYFLWKPLLMVMDPELIKKIMIEDFDSFLNRPHISDNKGTDSVLNSLLLIDDEYWRSSRYALSHLFSRRRFKAMKPKLDQHANKFVQRLEPAALCEEDVELVRFTDHLTAGSIMSAFIGVEMKSESEFLRAVKFAATPDAWTATKTTLYSLMPNLYRAIVKTTLDKRIWETFAKFVEDVINIKMKNPDDGIDLFSFLVKCKMGQVKRLEGITHERLVGDVFGFFFAGQDTVSISLSLVLLELSRNLDIQSRLRAEIGEAMKTQDNHELSYETLKSMTLLDNVIKETLRMYPLLGVLKRVASKDYKIDENFTIPKGTEVLVPCRALHYDSQYFEDPNQFNPDRFSDSTSWLWMPFGKGPRQCIGLRFAEMEIKIALAALIVRYEVLPSIKMEIPVQFYPRVLLATNRPKNGVWVKLRELPKGIVPS